MNSKKCTNNSEYELMSMAGNYDVMGYIETVLQSTVLKDF